MTQNDRFNDFILVLLANKFNTEEIAEYCSRFLEKKDEYHRIQDEYHRIQIELDKLAKDFNRLQSS